jgi:hypothetical protein
VHKTSTSEKNFRQRRIKGEHASLSFMARTCLVSFKDADGFRHSVEVEAERLYEAAALAARSFADAGCPPTSGSELDITSEGSGSDAQDHTESRERMGQRSRQESEGQGAQGSAEGADVGVAQSLTEKVLVHSK